MCGINSWLLVVDLVELCVLCGGGKDSLTGIGMGIGGWEDSEVSWCGNGFAIQDTQECVGLL